VIICTLPTVEALHLTSQAPGLATDLHARVLAYVYRYDQHGGMATTFKEEKQELEITKHSTKRFAAQHVVVALEARAHDVLI
jgi:hypothetical protein